MPFTCPRACADTNVLCDFYLAGCIEIIWHLYPDGVWIDPYVHEELKVKYNLDVYHALQVKGLEYISTKNYSAEQLMQMAEIKTRKRALKFADISCIVNSGIHDAVCLSADNAVVSICIERNIKVARHCGILEEAIRREIITKNIAYVHLIKFLDNGLTLPPKVRGEYLGKFSEV